MIKLVTLIVLFIAVVNCQEPIEEEKDIVEEARVGKRGLSLGGFDGYSNYLSPVTSRGIYNTRQYAPVSDYGYDGVNYGIGASNFASGGIYPGSGNYYQQSFGTYPYRGGYPTSYAYQRQYNSPVNTYPLGGIGTVGPASYGGAYNGFNSYSGGLNRFGGGYDGYNGYQQQFGGLSGIY